MISVYQRLKYPNRSMCTMLGSEPSLERGGSRGLFALHVPIHFPVSVLVYTSETLVRIATAKISVI